MSPVRGYPPLLDGENERSRLFAVIGLAVIDAAGLYSGDCDFSEEAEQRAADMAGKYIEKLLSVYGRIDPLCPAEALRLWLLYMDPDSPLLDRTVGISLNYELMEKAAEQVLKARNLRIQFIVSSVYSETFDISLALDEVATLSRHAALLNLTSSVCGHRSESIEKQFPDMTDNTRQAKLDLEKLFFNCVITLRFPEACAYFLKIMDMDLKSAETALFIKTRVCNRLAWIIYVLGSPPHHGPHNPLKNNVMAAIDALDAASTIDEMKEGVRDIFAMLEEDYHAAPSPNKLSRITAYIVEHYQDCNLDATQICAAFDMTPPSLSRLFRREMDTTMLDYIHSVRLSHAKELMLKTDQSLQSIAAQCGYFSSWTMSRAFKKYEGITPGEYRRSCYEEK